jgi:cell division septum initiation protein DivIVA
MDNAISLLDKLSSSLKSLKADTVAAQADLDRIRGLGDQLLANAKREAQNEAGALTDKAVAEAKAKAGEILAAAAEQEIKIIADANERAKAILSKAATEADTYGRNVRSSADSILLNAKSEAVAVGERTRKENEDRLSKGLAQLRSMTEETILEKAKQLLSSKAA